MTVALDEQIKWVEASLLFRVPDVVETAILASLRQLQATSEENVRLGESIANLNRDHAWAARELLDTRASLQVCNAALEECVRIFEIEAAIFFALCDGKAEGRMEAHAQRARQALEDKDV